VCLPYLQVAVTAVRFVSAIACVVSAVSVELVWQSHLLGLTAVSMLFEACVCSVFSGNATEIV